MEKEKKPSTKQPSTKTERPQISRKDGFYTYSPKNPDPKHPKDKIKPR